MWASMRLASAAFWTLVAGDTVDWVLAQALSNNKDDNAEDSMIPGLIDIGVPKKKKLSGLTSDGQIKI
jgi:hypothetical protein